MIQQKNFPCVAAVRSLAKSEYLVGAFETLGTGCASSSIASDLRKFLAEQRKSQSPWLTYWAVFPQTSKLDEEEFEKALWIELSQIAAESRPDTKWDPRFSDNPKDKNFGFSFDGTAFFVVGLHPNSSRKGRQFPYAAMIFNVFDQFEELERQGKYDAMVKVNRARDLAFQGSLNPMIEKYGDDWEAIQYSGRTNTEEWQCPFAKLISVIKKPFAHP